MNRDGALVGDGNAVPCGEVMAEDGGRSSLHRLSKDKGDLTSRDVFDAAAAGDELAAKVEYDTAFYLAVGAMNLMHLIDPDMIVFAGGMIAAALVGVFIVPMLYAVFQWLRERGGRRAGGVETRTSAD